MQFYTDPPRESDKWSLPDAEVFYVDVEDLFDLWPDSVHSDAVSDALMEDGIEETPDPDNPVHRDTVKHLAGWYWWSCFPGCLPDGDPIGPFSTEEEAIADARSYND